MYKAKTFDEALDKKAQLVADWRIHTSSLYVHPGDREQKIQKHYEAMKTCRVLINTPASQGGIEIFTTLNLLRHLHLDVDHGVETPYQKTLV